MIRTESTTTASAATVHELLVDVDAWNLWSPHVASVSSDRDRVEPGWVGLVASLSTLGQRRRIARLVKLAEIVEGRARGG